MRSRTAAISILAFFGALGALPVRSATAQEMQTRSRLVPSPGTATVHLDAPRDDQDVLRELEVEVGKSVYVRTSYSAKRVSVGNPDIVDVVILSPREFQLVALSVGATNVVVFDPRNVPMVAIDVHVGAVYSHIAAELRRVLSTEDIQLESAGHSVLIKGSLPSAMAVERALTVARAFFPPNEASRVVSLLEVGGHQQVMIEITIAEIKRTLRRALGTNFHSIIGSDGTVFEFFSLVGSLTDISDRSFTFDLNNFDLLTIESVIAFSDRVNLGASGFGIGSGIYQLFFELVEENNLGKILAEPTLVARSGATASFLVGGEIPIPVAQGGAFGSITVDYKSFGVGVRFTPTVLAPDRIHLQVSPEVSEPDFAIGTSVGGVLVPGFTTRRASTSVELADGQSFAIAGLLRDDISENVDKYPILGDIPVLGSLFRSSQFRSEQTELVMIVTAHLVKPLGPGPHPLPIDHFIEPSAFEFYLLGRLEALLGPASSARSSGATSGGLIGPAGHRVTAWPEEELDD